MCIQIGITKPFRNSNSKLSKCSYNRVISYNRVHIIVSYSKCSYNRVKIKTLKVVNGTVSTRFDVNFYLKNIYINSVLLNFRLQFQ